MGLNVSDYSLKVQYHSLLFEAHITVHHSPKSYPTTQCSKYTTTKQQQSSRSTSGHCQQKKGTKENTIRDMELEIREGEQSDKGDLIEKGKKASEKR